MRITRIVACFLLPVALVAASGPLRGSYALQSGAPKVDAYLTDAAGGDRLSRRLTLWMAHDRQTIRTYDVEMTKLIHVIVVSDDFTQFLHIHPAFEPDGTFTIDQRLPKAALYHVYADANPAGIGQQVFRFDVAVGDVTGSQRRTLEPTGRSASAGPYAVTLAQTPLRAGRETDLAVHIARGGKPATDLHPYLGALAHAVFLNANNLTYVHVHPTAPGEGMGAMDMSGDGMHMDVTPLRNSMTSSPDMTLHLDIAQPGTYKLWLQFRGGSSLYVAPFVLTVS